MSRWMEIPGTSKKELKTKLKKVAEKLHEFLQGTYNASIYAKLGSSIRLHKTELKGIIKIPDIKHNWWKKIKNRVGEVPNWVTPKNIDRNDPNYFNNE